MSRKRTLKEIQEDIRTLTRVPSEFIHAKLDELAEEVGELGNPRWIPCSERLPDQREFIEAYIRHEYAAEFLVMIEGANRATTLYYSQTGVWFGEQGELYKVEAWMPLPEPYREE